MTSSPGPRLEGRGALVAALGRVLERTDVNGAIVFGDTGMGKSSLAAYLAEHGGADTRTFLVQGSAGLAALPYGALAPLLPEVGASGLGNPLAVLRAVMAQLRQQSEGRRCLVVVDDVHLLDRESNHLLAQLVISGATRLLGFAGVESGDLADLGSLIDDVVLARFDLGPLAPDDVAETCRNLLGADIVRGASTYFAERSGGNPLLLRLIVLHAVRTQCLVESDGVYVLLREPEDVDPALRDLVASEVRHLPAAERDVLDVVALGGEVPFVLLSGVAGDAAVRNVLGYGLIRAAPKDRSIAVCNPPLYGPVLSSLVAPGRRAELRARLLPRGAALPPFGRARMSHLEWALDCGEHIDDDDLLDAARVACTETNPQVALRLAESVRSPDRAVAAAVEIARAKYLLRRVTPGSASVLALLNRAQDDDSLASAAILSAQLVTAETGRGEALFAVADAWEQRLLELHPHQDDDQMQEQLRNVGLLRVRALNLSGGFVESEQYLRDVLQVPLPARQAALAHAFLGEVLGATGRCVQGLRHLEQALQLVQADRFALGQFRDLVVFRHLALLISNGEFGEARRAIDTYGDFPGKDYFFISGTLAVLRGFLDVRVGRFREAFDTLRHAVAVLRLADREVMLPCALGLLAWTAAVLDRGDETERSLQEFESSARRGPIVYRVLAKAYALAARAHINPDGDHHAELSALAAEARAAGHSGCEKHILELLLLLGVEQHAPRLAETTAHFEGAEAQLLHRYAHALIDDDPGLLMQTGDLAEQHGNYLLAVGASAQAVRLFTQQGDHKSQRLVRGVLRRRSALIERAVTPGAGGEDVIGRLTPREAKIAALVASGGTNREIAETLTVSTRTVEGHLYRIYLKLGINGRDELAEVVGLQADMSRS